jgi:hypothetical protein
LARSTDHRLLTRRGFIGLVGVATLALSCGVDQRPVRPTADNALVRQTLGMYGQWVDWLTRAGVSGYLGETNTPNAQKPWPQSEVDKWLTLLEKVYETIDRAGPTIAGVTAHVASVTSSGGEGFKVYGPDRDDVNIGQRTFASVSEQAAVIEAHGPTPDSRRGMNTSAGALAPGEFGAGNPGTYGEDYVYPDQADFEFLLERGHNLVRIPFRWERVQVRAASEPNGNPELKDTEVERLMASFDAAARVGMKVIPSVQNYGGYTFSTYIFGIEDAGKIGSSKLSIGAYGAFMKQLAQRFAGHPAVFGYDIMNEPKDLPGRDPAKTWEHASQAAVDAIAQVDTSTRIWVSGYHTRAADSYDGLYSFIANHPDPWIESAATFGYTTHCYYGPGAGYLNTYDEAVALWESKGY